MPSQFSHKTSLGQRIPCSGLSPLFFGAALSLASQSTTAALPDFLLRDNVWEQLSIPADSGNRTVRELFADDLPASSYQRDWVLYLIDGSANQYVAPSLDDTIPLAAGFWMFQRTGSDVQLDLPDLPAAGGSGGAGCAAGSGCVTVPLDTRNQETAFSMIGSGGNSAVNLGDVRVRTSPSSSVCGIGCSIEDAVDNEILGNFVYRYDSETNTYQNLLDTGSINPWYGVWMGTTASASQASPVIVFPGTEQPTGSTSSCMEAPALPPVAVSDPGKTVVDITSEAELQSAIASLNNNTVLLLQPGTYQLSNTLWIQNSNVTIRGASNSCDDVVLVGKGMENAAGGNSVPHGVWTDSNNLRVQNLTIKNVYFHGVIINGTGNSPEIYNVRLIDTGQQFIKANPIGFGNGPDDGRVEYSVMEYTNGPPTSDHGGGTGYTNGVDVHGGKNWVIRNNLFENFHAPDNAQNLWNPAILMWNGASNTLAENNRFIDVDRAIAFGLLDRQNDHSGGIIRNNMIVMRENLFSSGRKAGSDAQILVWSSPGTSVLHNTIMTQGNVNHAVQLRFDSAGSTVKNNLVDASIIHRDGSNFTQSGNVNTNDIGLFIAPIEGDLHLVSTSSGITDAVPRLTDAALDVDGQQRQPGTLVDAGADELP